MRAAPTTVSRVFPHCDSDSHRRGGIAGHVGDEGAQGNGRPVPQPEDEERGEGDPGGRPHGGDRAVGNVEIEPDLRSAYIGAADDDEPESPPKPAGLHTLRYSG